MRAVQFGLLAMLASGCAYDWNVRAVDAASDSSDASDSSVSETSSPPDSAVADTITDTAPSCADLLAKVAAARTEAKKCTSTAMICMTEILDECGCRSTTAQVGAATNLYDNAVKAFKGAGCTSIACGTCAMPLPGQCLPADAGGLACKGP